MKIDLPELKSIISNKNYLHYKRPIRDYKWDGTVGIDYDKKEKKVNKKGNREFDLF